MNAIFSRYAAEDDWQDLLKDFVAVVPQRIAAIQSAVEAADVDTLRMLVHQLKGACGSYGFDIVTPMAQKLEQQLTGNFEPTLLQPAIAEFSNVLQRLTWQPLRSV